MTAFLQSHAIPVNPSCREIGIDLANFLKSCIHGEILTGIDDPGYSAIAFPAIQPVAHAAWKLKPPVIPSMSNSSPAK